MGVCHSYSVKKGALLGLDVTEICSSFLHETPFWVPSFKVAKLWYDRVGFLVSSVWSIHPFSLIRILVPVT